MIHERIIKPLRVICRRSGRKRGVSLCRMSSLCHSKVGGGHAMTVWRGVFVCIQRPAPPSWSMIVRSLSLGVDAPIFGRPSCGNSKKESPARAGLKAITMKSKYP